MNEEMRKGTEIMRGKVWLLILLATLLTSCAMPAAEAGSAGTEAQTAKAATPTPTAIQQMEVVIAAETATPFSTPIPSPTPPPTPIPTPTPVPTPTPTPIFVEGEPIVTEDSYRSRDIAIFLSTVNDTSKTISPYGLVYHLADIYVRDVTSLKAAFSREDWKYRTIAPLTEIAKNNNAVLAISGDYIRHREEGICLRNGVLYRDKADKKRDVGVIYRDGTMKTYEAGDVPQEIVSDPNVWHIIGFGPRLLDDNGKAKTSFHTQVAGMNPRVVIGYYGPNHFCFMLVEGRQWDKQKEKYSAGLTMKELSVLCETLGFAQAFNLDGGATASMYFNGQLVNHKKNYPREVHDIFYLPYSVYSPEEEETPAAEPIETSEQEPTAEETAPEEIPGGEEASGENQ